MYLSTIDKTKLPSACIACGACMSVCPQGIKIPEILADFSDKISK
jgi:predicted aldo/keto reductase-like oxidoreductase